MKEKFTDTKTLGPISANVIQRLIARKKEIFTLDNAAEIYGRGRQDTTHFLRELVNRGVLARIKSGVFLILKMGQEDAQLSNWPIIVRMLVGTKKYYISHYSAMRLHGMTTHALRVVTITTSERYTPKKIYTHSYQFIYSKPTHFWGLCELWVTKQEKVWVSDLERTILDGLERPELCGGIKEVVRGIWNKQKQFDWEKLVRYAKKYHTKAAVKRLGLILEMLQLGISYLPLLEETIAARKDYVLLDPNGEKVGKYLSRWRLRLNMNLEELKGGVWG